METAMTAFASPSLPRRGARLLPLAAALVAAAALPAMANISPIRWSGNDTYEQTSSVAPGQTAEVCGMIDPKLPVQWSFNATGPLTFNIHRHSGQDVVYSVRSYLTREQKGTFSPTLQYEWCWMWTNETDAEVTFRVDLKR